VTEARHLDHKELKLSKGIAGRAVMPVKCQKHAVLKLKTHINNTFLPRPGSLRSLLKGFATKDQSRKLLYALIPNKRSLHQETVGQNEI